MSMADYQDAKILIAQAASKCEFAGPRPEALIAIAENALDLTFPPIYRSFLLDFGAGSIGSFECYGVIDNEFKESSVPDGIWYTLNERRTANLPHELIVIGDTGLGELYCIDLSKEGGAVVAVDPGSDVSAREIVAADFGAFFLEHVRKATGSSSG